MTTPIPLRLALDPLIPTRATGHRSWFEYGFQLRLPDGPLVDGSDPLLDAYAARILSVTIDEDDDEQLQADSFEPGSFVCLVPESAAEPEIGVWDAEGLHRAGCLPDRSAPAVAAALECGLTQRALILTEDRTPEDGRREGLDLLVFHDGFVEIDTAAVAGGFLRPERQARARLVLVADGTGDVRWWDPAATAGPIAADDLPMSADLRRAMQRLRASYAKLAPQDDDERSGFERFEAAIDRRSLDEQAAALWKRARAELGRRYAIGFLGTGMERPVWSPEELDDDDDAIPF